MGEHAEYVRLSQRHKFGFGANIPLEMGVEDR